MTGSFFAPSACVEVRQGNDLSRGLGASAAPAQVSDWKPGGAPESGCVRLDKHVDGTVDPALDGL